MIDECRACGSGDYAEISSWGEEQTQRMCADCGDRRPAPVRFRVWRGDPVHYTRIEVVQGGLMPVSRRNLRPSWPPRPHLTVWCGPPAPRPLPPTPEELLIAAGLGEYVTPR